MPIKLGTIAETLPFSKIYLGDVLKYKKGPSYKDTEFSTCRFPTSWTAVTTGTKYTGSNTYGTWTISATNYSTFGGSYSCDLAFDRKTSTQWRSNTISSSGTVTLEIECPCAIKPTQLHLYASSLGSGSAVQGYNEETGTWEDLYVSTTTSSSTNVKPEITTNNFYTKFRVVCKRYSSSLNQAQVTEFQVISGTIRQEG